MSLGSYILRGNCSDAALSRGDLTGELRDFAPENSAPS